MERRFSIIGIEYELYQAASKDWCVSVYKYGEERADYNIGTLSDALLFILSESEIEMEDEE